jgi:hypothetical protein
VPAPALALLDLSGGVEPALASVPPRPGVGQLLGPDGRNLVLGTTANLRRWAASHLGLGKPAPAGRRPRTNLAGIAASVGFVETRGPFHQRLTYERLMAPLVPLSARRDLKPPAFLQLDPTQRFPRVTIAGLAPEGPLFGPFRDRRAAEKARDAVHRVFPLRPCDFRFEPDPSLPLGLACLYAQVRSCAAPCLARTSEEEYRALASRAAAWLADPGSRADAPAAVPPTVADASGRALVVDAAHGAVGLFPVLGGCVLDSAVRWPAAEALEAALRALEWPAERAAGDSDWPWLASWLRGSRARTAFLLLGNGEPIPALAARVRALLPAAGGRGAGDDKVGATRGRD